ncbi:hypothetical protein A1O3_03787 [Capronia epimyces CBS 606.96]|uniref:Fido domain-containing protein n=1 Tax=Capronia epimyces CBS 606.96 TaxID=1182542 RepID=W9Y2Y5_9EURO|nr:uncharacterized protein A1O3_03787 [Capronia epimyces CBS 606.96]EXJ86833.1 hypothetical protein A1O3_03787 [Capronia epimyces CBS 606.96]
MHMVEAVVRDDQEISEDLIKETHRILCSGVPVIVSADKQVVPSSSYAGKYRNVPVRAGNTNFVVPQRVPTVMARFITELNEYLRKAEAERQIDPFYIAAHACGEFVNIHPFLDGNGRTCRLILNTILLKYAGIVCPIGECESERNEYLNIARASSEDCVGNGRLAAYVVEKVAVVEEGGGYEYCQLSPIKSGFELLRDTLKGKS